ncbi:alpha/beta hydrolase [Actinoplanes solisilvae]|uniref:alpha/beta hydrolase n=1 Tax=Actinoplanes solisilvae TaxID=2486853 RepID=UPI000FD7002B|nr:alpha/beta hydrolase [Actinoplanes solisilvae]
MGDRKGPALLLVHGAWHRQEVWRTLIEQLPDDLDVRTVQLPSSAPVPPSQLGDLHDDAKAIRAAADAVDGPVVALAHSYGGAPMTQGLAGSENVRRLVYLAAFQLDVGESMTSAVGGEIPYFWGTDHLDEGYYEMTDPINVFYPDLEPDQAEAAAGALGPHSASSLVQSLSQAAWRTIDSTYIHAVNQPQAPLFEPYLARSRRVREIAAAHSPFLNKPRELAELLRQDLDDVSDD